MSTEDEERIQLLQGTLDLIVLRTLATMGVNTRIASLRGSNSFQATRWINQGTSYPALVPLEQQGWIQGTWEKTGSNRDAKFYTLANPDRRR